MSHSSIHLRHPTSLSVFFRALPGHFIFRLSKHESDWFTWLRTSRRAMCTDTLPNFNDHTWGHACLKQIHFFPQSCPSFNLWSNVSSFSASLLFLTSKPLHILFSLHGILPTERKSNSSFNAKASLITLAQRALSYHSLCFYQTSPLAYLYLHFLSTQLDYKHTPYLPPEKSVCR